ncbi:MAG: two-component system, cell cycle response regulator, partial [Solirubrobacteraceae bacterium]|nr:two-component system, cell cycle response regulator [Solirubrobacteraceae bacterium]
LRERRLLIVEDSGTMRRVMRRFLQSTGFVIFEAGDGEEALTLAARERPDVILLDVQIPRLDGYGVLASLQTDPELGEVPVVLVTSRGEPEDVAEGLRRGAHDYLRKPFEQPELLARVHAAMRTKTLRDELHARNAQLERLVSADPVTGLLNRAAILNRVRALVSRSERHQTPLSLVLLDVVGFTALNAAYGHAAGDAVLEAVAARVAAGLREEDVAGRWGGDELLVVASDADAAGVAALLVRLRAAVAAAPVAFGAERLGVGVAAGASTWAAGDDADALLARARAALAADLGERPGALPEPSGG